MKRTNSRQAGFHTWIVIVIVVAVLALGGLGYFFFFKGTTVNNGIVADESCMDTYNQAELCKYDTALTEMDSKSFVATTVATNSEATYTTTAEFDGKGNYHTVVSGTLAGGEMIYADGVFYSKFDDNWINFGSSGGDDLLSDMSIDFKAERI